MGGSDPMPRTGGQSLGAGARHGGVRPGRPPLYRGPGDRRARPGRRAAAAHHAASGSRAAQAVAGRALDSLHRRLRAGGASADAVQGGAQRGGRARQELRRHRGPPLRQRRAREGRRGAAARRGGARAEHRLNEFELIRRYFDRAPNRALLGIGDDCALLRPNAGLELAITTDMLIEGRHFLADAAPRSLGHKALAVNLSDLAAMGAAPRYALLSLGLPSPDPAWLEEFPPGFFALP